MIAPVLELFDIEPDYDLAIMSADQTLNGIVSRVIGGLDEVITRARPDRILVHGDTATAMAAALAGFQRKIPVAHVEAGLRTYDLTSPWPEEMNRRVVDLTSDLLFAPTRLSKDNLTRERLSGRVIVTGNTVIDALKMVTAKLDRSPRLRARLDGQHPETLSGRRMVLVTGHRRENFGEGMRGICAALAILAERSDIDIVYPVHLNPNVRGPVTDLLAGRDNIHLIPPQSYLGFVRLMQRAHIILTDSGGVQEEAPSLGKPVLVMRDVTERPEALEAGTTRLVGTDTTRIVDEVSQLLDDASAYRAVSQRANPYGDGHAADRIIAALMGRAVTEFATDRDLPALPIAANA
jgi:UDP-N-acetylglucosamine 2-epimerase (non-hydrolysing)